MTVASVGTGPRFGAVVEDILALVGALAEGCLGVRVGLVSCEVVFVVWPVVEAGFGGPERTSGRSGDVSREVKGEDCEVEVCVAGWEGG